MCPSCSFTCFSPCSAFLRNPLPCHRHWVCMCSDDHCGDNCDYMSTPSEETAREDDRGVRYWTVRTKGRERERLLWKLVKYIFMATLIHWLGPCTKHLECKLLTQLAIIGCLLAVRTEPQDEWSLQSLFCSCLSRWLLMWGGACITSCCILCMLYITQNLTAAQDIWCWFFFFFNSREKEKLKIREEKEATPLED